MERNSSFQYVILRTGDPACMIRRNCSTYLSTWVTEHKNNPIFTAFVGDVVGCTLFTPPTNAVDEVDQVSMDYGDQSD